MDKMKSSIDVFIPAYRSDHKLNDLLRNLQKQTIKPRKIYILHTKIHEDDVQALPPMDRGNLEVISINKEDFDHGATRAYGASLSDADILMFMTQDAVPDNKYLIENLIKPYEDSSIGATYGRQLSSRKDKLIERYTRQFNYPKNSRIKSAEDLDELGIKTYFCSNVCSTYRRDVYEEQGGFVDRTMFNEDMIMAYSIINSGYKIAYVAEARVQHSHKYSYMQQFTRNFDLGVSHKEYEEIFSSVKSESEGIQLVKDTMMFLIDKNKAYLIPDLILTSGAKYLGYSLGKRYNKLPKEVVRKCSMNKSYWD